MPPRKRVKPGEHARDGENSADVGLEQARQVAKVKKSRKVGKLARMLELPLEVFTEIASYVSPYDLLQLARSTKALREIFMSKRSKHIWVASRTAMDIPDLEEFSEPYYADLLFSRRCHAEGCDNKYGTKVSFALGVRLCKRCLDSITIQGYRVTSMSRYDLGILDEEKGLGLFPSFPVSRGYRLSNMRYLLSSITSVVAAFKQCKSEEEKAKLIADVQANTDHLNEKAKRIESWCAQQAKAKYDTNAALCAARRKSIRKRLLAMGYTTGDLNSRHDEEGWKWETILDQPRLLTETIWKKILPQLEETLRIRKDLHRIMNHKKLTKSIEDRLFSLWRSKRDAPEIASINPTSLFEYFPVIKSMMDDPNCIGPVPDEVWKSIDNGFGAAAKSFAKVIEDECAAMMDKAYQEPDNDGAKNDSDTLEISASTKDTVSAILLHATSLFKYKHKKCDGNLVSYAGSLKLRASIIVPRERSADWYREDIEVPKGVIGMASALLRRMSLPETSSMLFLENFGKVFRCDRCLRYGTWWDAMTWSGLVWHFYEENRLHEDRIRKRQELNVDVPLRNEHDLAKLDEKKIYASMSPTAKQIVESTSDNISDGDTYAKLSNYTLRQWGYDPGYYFMNVDPKWGGDADADGNETDEEKPVWTKGDNYYDWTCKLCATLGTREWLSNASGLGDHMKRIHGTDFDGLPLVINSKAKLGE